MRLFFRPVIAIAAALAAAAILIGADPLGESQDHVRDDLIVGAGAQVARGADVYDRNCAVCHGDSALGFAEARLAFPQDHRACTRCHKPNNPQVMSLEQVVEEGRDHNLFPVGDPPPLRGGDALAALQDPVALFHYTRAAMPRYRPGTMTDQEYLDVTAFLLAVNGSIDGTPDVVLEAEDVGLAN